MSKPLHCLHGKSQLGAALIVMLVIMVIGFTALLSSSFSLADLNNQRQAKTAKALAQAKEALISYAISSENTGSASARPGNFLCPDTDAPGATGYGDENTSCAAGAIGRLPWRTLGLPELVDGEGEPLWYAISGNFRKSVSIVNSDTLGTLLVYDRDGSTLLTPPGSEAVAIVFAPGGIVGNQQRNTTANKTTASNYLEAANGRNNATVGGPFIATDKSDSFNDRLMIIRTRDFIPIIEKRVAKEFKTILENYRAANGVYPYPAPFSTCSSNASCVSNNSICRGRLPYTAAPVDWGGSYALPTTTSGSPWFVANRWYRVIYYSAGTSRLATAPPGCSAALNVSGNSTAALFFMPGTPLGSVVRTYANNNLSWYLEDTENQNMDDNYVTPTSNSNDQLYVLP
jgi:type II secretory pathway pseudopilin PulG